MKQKLLNNFRLRALMLVAILCAAFTGAWADDTYTIGWGTASGNASTNFANVAGSVDEILSFSTAQNSSSSTPAYNNSSKELRLYYGSGNGGSITLTPAEGVTITGFVMTTSTAPTVGYSVDGGAATTLSTSNNTYTVSGISASSSLTIQNVNTTNTQLRIKTIEISYTTAGGGTSSLVDNDLDLDPVVLSFDLYNNSSAQTINYSTSSSGAVTIADNDYATFDIDEDNKTITVTPTAMTPNAQTITVNQAADDDYKAGSATFTFTITDSTPIPTHIVTFSVNGATTTEEVEEGTAISFPANPTDVNGKTFVGWVAEAIDGTTNDAPTFVTSATMGQNDVTFYAVFAYASGSGSSEVVDELNKTLTGVTGTSYSAWSGLTASSSAVYAGQSAGGNDAIQLRATSPSSIITTVSGGKVKKVVLTWYSGTADGRKVSIYGKNSAYTAASDLYSSSTQGTLLGELNIDDANRSTWTSELAIDEDVEYIGIRSKSGALYLKKVEITWSIGGGTSYSDYCTTVDADTKQDAELSFSVAEVNANISEQYEAPTLNTATGFNGTVEYTSSDESVAQIMDSETGELRLLTGGTTTITATFAGNDDFRPGYASYTLTVTDNRIATTTTVENIVLDLSDVATLTQLNPVVKDAEDNIIDCTYEDFPPKVSYEIVSDDSYIIGSIDNNSGEITLNAVVGTATLKAYYNAFNVSSTYKPSECTFTITVESTQTIAEVRAQGSGDVTTKGIVTSCSGTTAYIQDANAAICVYGSSLTVGDEVKVSGTLTDYNGLLEITSPTVTVLSQNNTVTPEVMTIADINASSKQGWLVKIENATVTAINGQNTTIAQGENTIVVRNISGVELAVDDVVTLTGNIGCYNNKAQIANPTDVTVVELEENTITVKQRYYYNEEYHFNDIPADPQYQIGIVNFEHITFVVEANGATATAVSSDNTILEIQETAEANTFEAIGTGGSWEGQVATVTFTTPRTSTHEAAERTITFLVKRPAAPTFSIEPGTYGETQYVELSSITGISNYGFEPEYEPEIWYVTSDDDYDFDNNNEPDQIVGHKYNGTPIEISKTTTIKAWTYRYDLNWSEAATATYIIDPTPSINIAETTINAPAAETVGTVALTYVNLSISDFSDFEVHFYNNDGSDATAPDWMDAEVAEDNGNYVVSYFIGENATAEERTAYFKVYALDNDANDIYSDLVTVTQAGAVIDYATLPFEFNGVRADIEYINGLEQSGLGTDYSNLSSPTTRLKFDGTGDWLELKINERPGTLTFDIKGNGFSGGTFKVVTSVDGETYTDLDTYTSLGDLTEMSYELDEDVRYIRWTYTEKSSGNVGLGNIKLEPVPDYARNVSSIGNYGTICLPYAATITGAELYTIAGKDNTGIYLSLETETETVAGKPYIFKATDTKIKAFYTGERVLAPITEDNNGLIGSFTKEPITKDDGTPVVAGTPYVLKNNKICPAGNGVYVGANKAYIDLAAVPENNGSGVKLFYEGSEDGITGVAVNGNAKEIYDLSGRRVIQPIRGIYIIDGKKVLVK